jgi:hypothetical protein
MRWFKKKVVVTLESIYIDEVWKEVQRLVNEKKVYKWFIVTTADYDYLKSLYNLQMSKIEMANIMAQRYKWMLEQGQLLELKLYLTRLANNITLEEQEHRLRLALHFMAKGLKVKPTEVMPGWFAYNNQTKELLKTYGLNLVDEEAYKKVYADYEIIENIWKKKK